MTSLIVVLIVLAYFVPSLVAYFRDAPSFGSVIVVNVFLGFTGIGWVVALAMACRSKRVAS